jgi:hypothetical protein
MTWESVGKVRNMMRRSMGFILGSEKYYRTLNPRGLNRHECQVAEGNYEWDNSCGGECY